MKKVVFLLVASLGAVAAAQSSVPGLSLSPVGTLKSGPFRDADPRVAEINAYDAEGRRIYVVNPLDARLDVIDIDDPATPLPAAPVDIVGACEAALGDDCPIDAGGEPNSVAIHGRLMAVAYANAVRTSNGHAVFFELRGAEAPRFVAAIEVGALPDMVTFDEKGRYALTANEGEPSADYTIDPPGSVSIIAIDRSGRPGAVRHVGFERFDTPEARAELKAAGVRVFGPGASVSQDLEPEYITTDRNKAYVSLQENNAVAIVNIAGATIERIVPLGLKDFSLPGNAIDPSDRDGGINIANWPVHGMYMPDAIQSFRAKGGRTFVITANEGDARDYDGYSEEVRVGNSSYVLDPVIFPNAAALKNNAALGRLTVTTASGDLDGDRDFDRIQAFGGRSVSILDQQGRLVWDSGDMLERLSASLDGTLTLFNTTNSANSRDNRSDDKSIEPEAVVVGYIGGRPYGFVGLERDGGIAVFDLSTPEAPVLVTYANNRRFPADPASGAFLACSDTVDCGDLGPEGLTFVPAEASPTGRPLLIVSNEVSSTTTVWEVQ